jgi:hypothetical protein
MLKDEPCLTPFTATCIQSFRCSPSVNGAGLSELIHTPAHMGYSCGHGRFPTQSLCNDDEATIREALLKCRFY